MRTDYIRPEAELLICGTAGILCLSGDNEQFTESGGFNQEGWH